MLKHCSNKLAFSNTRWYLLAIDSINSRSWLFKQKRGSATLLDFNPLNINTTPQPTLPRLEPIKPPIPDKIMPQPTDLFRRCDAFKKLDGKQCKRSVLVSRGGEQKAAYCYQHDPKQQKNKTNIVRVHKRKDPLKSTSRQKLTDCWDLWVNPQLEKRYKDMIRQEIKKPVSSSDQDGYIYVYSLDEGPRVSRQRHAYFKIGRTNDPHRRMYQVSHACRITPKIIELFPSFPANGDVMSTNLETIAETTTELPKCPISHRVERLILLELKALYSKGSFNCLKCGTTHREWLKIKRSAKKDGTLMTDEELFDMFIRPNILRWIQYGVLASALNKST